MHHFGVICPATPGHLNPMVALADALRQRGHRVTFFLMGYPSSLVTGAGFEVVETGGAVFPAEEFRAGIEKLGTLHGRAALRHTFGLGVRSAEAVLKNAPEKIRKRNITALIVDQAASPGGTVAEAAGIPFVTVCNALMLNPEPAVPPFFTHWLPQPGFWPRLKNRVLWAGLNRYYRPILRSIQRGRKEWGLPFQRTIPEGWSRLLQISQQPAAFEFPRENLPQHFHFVGPLRGTPGNQPIPFPWERLDGRPLIYASFGTLQNRVAEDFQTIARACEGTGAQLVMSTGKGIRPEALGPLPGNPVVVDYAPQGELLKRASLAITHAGLNTVLDALTEGVPMVTVPVTNEQPGIAARVAWVGAGEMIPRSRFSLDTLRAAVRRVLADPSFKTASLRVSDSIRKAGGATRAAELIEEKIPRPR